MLPLILYVNPVPVGAVMVIVPEGTEQVGCVILTVGGFGLVGAALIVATVAVDVQATQPLLFFTVTL